MGSSIKVEDKKTEVGTCFPIQHVVCVFVNSSVGTQVDSESNTARLLKMFFFFRNWRLNSSSFPNKVSRGSYTFLG